MNPTYTITRIIQTSTVGANATLIPAYQVQFSVGNHGPFTLTFAQADFTTANVQKTLTDFATQINTLTPAS